MYFIGIDTSCYTTSIAVVDSDEKLIFDGRKLLNVKTSERGLRQSEAVFQHMNNLPVLLKEAMTICDSEKISCIGVSTKPRSMEGSYMPVFTAGYNLAEVVSSCLKVPIIKCSHQQGHIISGAWSIDKIYSDSLLVYHISGGTTELLKYDILSEKVDIVGGTEDLNAGQYIDRIGVALGFKFPCGKEMDKLCYNTKSEAIKLPLAVKNTVMSFSGPESQVQRLILKNNVIDEEFKSQIAISVFLNIAKALEKTIENACVEYGIKDVLLVGGVASNSVIRKELLNNKKLSTLNINISISKPEYSSDNAVGAAIYAKRAYQA